LTAWRDLVDRTDSMLGPVSPALARHWRAELDDVEQRVAHLERSAPARTPNDGMHAFVALATARLADEWDPHQLIDVAAAVELAHRATRHHRVVINADSSVAAPYKANVSVVLDGDWSITQAAVLVADIGPSAYQILVRGYGETQVGQLSGIGDALGLIRAAVALGALVADLPDSAVQDLWAAARLAPALRSIPAAVLAWATAVQGDTNAFSTAVPAPSDVQLPATSTTTSPAVGRS
jgi:hypothetical protein